MKRRRSCVHRSCREHHVAALGKGDPLLAKTPRAQWAPELRDRYYKILMDRVPCVRQRFGDDAAKHVKADVFRTSRAAKKAVGRARAFKTGRARKGKP